MPNTDKERIMNLGDEEAPRNALDYPDTPLTDEELSRAVRARDIPGKTVSEKLGSFKKKRYKKLVSIKRDADALYYFKAKGKGYQAPMNSALRAFMDAEKEKTGV